MTEPPKKILFPLWALAFVLVLGGQTGWYVSQSYILPRGNDWYMVFLSLACVAAGAFVAFFICLLVLIVREIIWPDVESNDGINTDSEDR